MPYIGGSFENYTEAFSLLWGQPSLDPLDQYTVGTAIKSASFASHIVYTYIELFLSYKRLFTRGKGKGEKRKGEGKRGGEALPPLPFPPLRSRPP